MNQGTKYLRDEALSKTEAKNYDPGGLDSFNDKRNIWSKVTLRYFVSEFFARRLEESAVKNVKELTKDRVDIIQNSYILNDSQQRYDVIDSHQGNDNSIDQMYDDGINQSNKSVIPEDITPHLSHLRSYQQETNRTTLYSNTSTKRFSSEDMINSTCISLVTILFLFITILLVRNYLSDFTIKRTVKIKNQRIKTKKVHSERSHISIVRIPVKKNMSIRPIVSSNKHKVSVKKVVVTSSKSEVL